MREEVEDLNSKSQAGVPEAVAEKGTPSVQCPRGGGHGKPSRAGPATVRTGRRAACPRPHPGQPHLGEGTPGWHSLSSPPLVHAALTCWFTRAFGDGPGTEGVRAGPPSALGSGHSGRAGRGREGRAQGAEDRAGSESGNPVDSKTEGEAGFWVKTGADGNLTQCVSKGNVLRPGVWVPTGSCRLCLWGRDCRDDG